jgi:hypothetical protein
MHVLSDLLEVLGGGFSSVFESGSLVVKRPTGRSWLGWGSGWISYSGGSGRGSSFGSFRCVSAKSVSAVRVPRRSLAAERATRLRSYEPTPLR